MGEGTVEVEPELRLELDGLLLHGELKPELEFSLPTGSTRTLPLFSGDGDVVALLVARATWLAREEDEGMFCFLKQIKIYIVRGMQTRFASQVMFLNKQVNFNLFFFSKGTYISSLIFF